MKNIPLLILIGMSLFSCNEGPVISSIEEDDNSQATSPTGPTAGIPPRLPTECSLTNEDIELLNAFNEVRRVGYTCGSRFFEATHDLSWDCALEIAAQAHSDDMNINNYFSHTSQDGRTFTDRINQANYTASARSEIIARGQPNVASVVQDWLDSDGHCSAIMSSSSNEVGAGITTMNDSQRKVWTANFGYRQAERSQ